MKKLVFILLVLSSFTVSYAALNESSKIATTNRELQIDNAQVKVWKTTIQPGKNQVLKMHRHDNNRVLVALDSGTLEVINDRNEKHYLKLEAGKSYFLNKDIPNELHKDINIGDHSIRVIVMELK